MPDTTVVLIVEDDQNIVDLVRSNLSVRGHGIEELLARINATLRRSRPAPASPPEPGVVTVGDVEIDLARRRAAKSGRLVHLTQTEFALPSPDPGPDRAPTLRRCTGRPSSPGRSRSPAGTSGAWRWSAP